MPACRVHLSLFPVSEREANLSLAVLRKAFVAAHWVELRDCHGGILLSCLAEGEFPPAETEEAFANRLAVAIWRRVGRFVKLNVELTLDDHPTPFCFERDRPAYQQLMRLA